MCAICHRRELIDCESYLDIKLETINSELVTKRRFGAKIPMGEFKSRKCSIVYISVNYNKCNPLKC